MHGAHNQNDPLIPVYYIKCKPKPFLLVLHVTRYFTTILNSLDISAVRTGNMSTYAHIVLKRDNVSKRVGQVKRGLLLIAKTGRLKIRVYHDKYNKPLRHQGPIFLKWFNFNPIVRK